MKRWVLVVLTTWMGIVIPAWAVAAEDSSIVRGGRLYDDWSREVKDKPPKGVNPAFPEKNTSVLPADTWRCSTCHGWDYKGNYGIVGIRKRQGDSPAAIVSVLKNATHRYGEFLREPDLLDLANFVSSGQFDMQAAIESGRASKKASVATNEKHFGTMCSNCHGLDGNRLRDIPPLGDAARQKPFVVLHTILSGHPGGAMPALYVLGDETAVGMLTFLQTLPTMNMAASIARGGRLYDDWQLMESALRQGLPHPAYPSSGYYANDPQTTWRCKECHGWDYQGNKGAYASGNHATGIKGIRGMAGADPARIVTVLRNSTHQYGAVLKYRDLQDLANFVSAGQVDMDVAIDRQNFHAKGDAARGGAYYQTICARCHGSEGKEMSTRQSLSRLFVANPWMGFHTILNGHPSEEMPALRSLDLQFAIDILTYVQGWPESRRP
jgi:mono/diheme cytochrome c family protein